MTYSQCGLLRKPKSIKIVSSSRTLSKQTLNLHTKCHQNKKKNVIQGKILDVQTHFKPTETFQYTHFSSCHPLGVKKGVKGEALRLLRSNSVKESSR